MKEPDVINRKLKEKLDNEIAMLALSGKQLPSLARRDMTALLIWASNEGHTSIVKHLLDYGADVEYKHNYALHIACSNGHTKIVELLLKCKENYNKDTGYTLELACHNGHTETAKLLLEDHKKVHRYTLREINQALITAYKRKYSNVVKLLLKHGADKSVLDDE